MLHPHFQVNRPVGTGHSRPNDVKRTRRALHETGYNRSPPTPSGRYDASASAAIERFQRDLGLKPDGVVLPGGPTERALDLALAARRTGGPDEQARLRDVFQAFAEAGLTFRPADPDDDRPGRFVDGDGREAGPQRLRQILQAQAGTGPQTPRQPAGPEAATALGTAARALRAIPLRLPVGVPAVPPVLWPLIGLGAAVQDQMQRVDPETAAAERDAATAPLRDRAARQRARRDGTPVARTIDQESGPLILPGGSEPPRLPNRTEFPGELPEALKDEPGEAPPLPEQTHILPGQEIKPARPEKFIFEALPDDEFWKEIFIFKRAGSPETRELNDRVGKLAAELGQKYGCNLEFGHGGFDESGEYRKEFRLKPHKTLRDSKNKLKNGSWLDVVLSDPVTKANILINTTSNYADGRLKPNEEWQATKVKINKEKKDVFIALPKPRKKGENLEEYVTRISQMTPRTGRSLRRFHGEDQGFGSWEGRLGCGTLRVNRIVGLCGPFSTAA